MAVERDKLNAIINMKEQELQREIAIATVRENMDEPIGAVLDQLGNVSSDYQAALMGMSWRDLLLSVVDDGVSEEAEEAEAAPAADPEPVEPPKAKKAQAKPEKPAKKTKKKEKKAPPRKGKVDAEDFDQRVFDAVNAFSDHEDDGGLVGASMGLLTDEFGDYSAAQIRGALNRLAESGNVKKTGTTRTTRYVVK